MAYKIALTKTAYRVRVSDYRILYDINDKEIIILILKIVHSKEVYE